MKATKPELRPRRRWSSSRGHMILTLAMGPYRPNSCKQGWIAVPNDIMHRCCGDV